MSWSPTAMNSGLPMLAPASACCECVNQTGPQGSPTSLHFLYLSCLPGVLSHASLLPQDSSLLRIV